MGAFASKLAPTKTLPVWAVPRARH